MLLNHDIAIDLTRPGEVPRVQVKQGDAYSRNIRVTLTDNGEAWTIPDEATAVLRYRFCDPENLTSSRGIFDLLEDGTLAYVFTGNVFELMPTNALMARPGLITMDVVLLYEDRALATFDFEIYVNPAPVSGTDVTGELGDYYRICTLEDINAEFDALRAAIVELGGSL